MNTLKLCKYGLMTFNNNDIWIGKSLLEYGEFSESEVIVFKSLIKPDDVVLDIGANIGCHTLVFSQLVGRNGLVFAYEPQRLIYYTLCANIAINNITNTYCLQNTVSNTEGRIDVPELDFRKPNSFGSLELNKEYIGDIQKTSVKM